MRCLLPCLALFLCALTPAARAETPPGRGFAFCTVTDTSHTPARVWASPVVEAEYPADDPAGFRRGLALADEFLAVVQSRGGEGNKMCNVTATAQEAAQLRAEAEATWNKRLFMMKIGDWREVAWTPKPWTPALVPASLTRYFLCSAMQTDLPGRIAISRGVASGIVARDVPGPRALQATHALNAAYTRDFQSVVQSHGLPVQGSCTPYDSLAEAQYAQQQQRKLMDGFNQAYTEVAWEPSASATAAALTEVSAEGTPSQPATEGTPAAVSAELQAGWGVRTDDLPPPLADALGLASAHGAWVRHVDAGSAAEAAGLQVLDVILQVDGETVVDATHFAALARRSAPGRQLPVQVWRKRQVQALSVTAPAATVVAPSATPAPSSSSDRYYCVAGIGRHSPEQNFETPVREVAGNSADMAALSVLLSDLLASLTRSAPGWPAFGTPTCYPSGAALPGETFCFASAAKRIGRAHQSAALFCNASRDGIDKRVQDMHGQAAGVSAQRLAWPE